MPETKYHFDAARKLQYEYIIDSNNNRVKTKIFDWHMYDRRRLRSVTLRNGAKIEYSYNTDGSLATRKFNNRVEKFGKRDPHPNRRYLRFRGFQRPVEVTVEVGGTITEVYFFSARGQLTKFSLGARKFFVETTTDRSVSMVYEHVSPAGAGPVFRRFMHAYIFDYYGKLVFLMDRNQKINFEKPLTRFLFMSEFFDIEAGIYYLYNQCWYHPALKQVINLNIPIPFIPPPQRIPHPGYISRPPLTFNYREINRRMYTAGSPLARLTGALRVISGLVVIFTSASSVVGVPFAVWGADQIATGLQELASAEFHTSYGGKLIQTHIDNGTKGKILTLIYDIGPTLYRGPGALPRGGGVKPPRAPLSARDAARVQEALSAARAPALGKPVAMTHPNNAAYLADMKAGIQLERARKLAAQRPRGFDLHPNARIRDPSGGFRPIYGKTGPGGGRPMLQAGQAAKPIGPAIAHPIEEGIRVIHVPEALAEGTYVYRLINMADETVYIGITGSHQRVNAHAMSKSGWFYQEVLTGPLPAYDAMVLEAYLIRGHMAFHGLRTTPFYFQGIKVSERLLSTGLKNMNRGLHPRNWPRPPRLGEIIDPNFRWRVPHPGLQPPPHPLQPKLQ